MHLLMDRMDWVLLICAHPLLDLTSSIFFPYAYLLIHGFDNLGFVEPPNIINAGNAILVNDVFGVVNQACYEVLSISLILCYELSFFPTTEFSKYLGFN